MKKRGVRYCAIFQNYFGDPWNALDFVIVVGSLLDIVAAQVLVSGGVKVALRCCTLLVHAVHDWHTTPSLFH